MTDPELNELTALRARREHDQQQLESDSIVASCGCGVKTNEVSYHKPGCKYRLICERDDARTFLALTEKRLGEAQGEVELLETTDRKQTDAIKTAHGTIMGLRAQLATSQARLVEAGGDYPNIDAIACGTISGKFNEWPLVKPEANRLLDELASLRSALAQVKQLTPPPVSAPAPTPPPAPSP